MPTVALLPCWWVAALVLAATAASEEARGGYGDADGQTLMAVKSGFGNAANALVDWDGGRDHCAWRGVKPSKTDHVDAGAQVTLRRHHPCLSQGRHVRFEYHAAAEVVRKVEFVEVDGHTPVLPGA